MKFDVSIIVFAKIKGVRPWPAVILEKIDAKFIVSFFGDQTTASVNTNQLKHLDCETAQKEAEKIQKKNNPSKLDLLYLKALKEIEQRPGNKFFNKFKKKKMFFKKKAKPMEKKKKKKKILKIFFVKKLHMSERRKNVCL